MNSNHPELLKNLEKHGLRATRARRLILALLNEDNGHLSVEDIIQALRAKGTPVSIATLYQNLNALVDAELLKRIKGPDNLVRYDANLAPHFHIICKKCGRMQDVKIGRNNVLADRPVDYQTGNKLLDWDIHDIKIEYKGTCPYCKG